MTLNYTRVYTMLPSSAYLLKPGEIGLTLHPLM